MDIIFEVGLCFLPFENLFIAPSAGWATITPIIFMIYLLFNLRYVIKTISKYKKIFIFIVAGLILSIINYVFNGIEIKNLINALISLAFGIIDFISIDIYFRQKKSNVNKSIKMLLIVYTISLLIGWIQFITIKCDIEVLKMFFTAIEKRTYIKVNRVQFTFTEPSFIGMHLFGILLPTYFATKEKKIQFLVILFSVSSIIFSSSIRILVDIIAIAGILYLLYIVKNRYNKKIVVITAVLVIVGIVSIIVLYNTNTRIKNIMDKGVYGDRITCVKIF